MPIQAMHRWKNIRSIPVVIRNPQNGKVVKVSALVDDDPAWGLLASLSDNAIRQLNFHNPVLVKAHDEDEGRNVDLHECPAIVSFRHTIVAGSLDVTPGRRLRTAVHRAFLKMIPDSDDLSDFHQAMTDVLPLRSVFISYSHRDKRFVRALARSVEAHGVKVWLDEGEILVGDSLLAKLRAAIDNVDFVLAVISRESVNSEWVKRELDIAMTQEIEGRKVKVLPLVRDSVQLPGFLVGKRWADFRKPWNRKKSIETIIRAVEQSR